MVAVSLSSASLFQKVRQFLGLWRFYPFSFHSKESRRSMYRIMGLSKNNTNLLQCLQIISVLLLNPMSLISFFDCESTCRDATRNLPRKDNTITGFLTRKIYAIIFFVSPCSFSSNSCSENDVRWRMSISGRVPCLLPLKSFMPFLPQTSVHLPSLLYF